ncbi:MAG: 7-carboxy-7-deazaguanine synthase [Syntrophaceae bacterium PtaU1.Bin231]|nr:MAG: 7-carboxy-7-deazaguanine synthase [Syntrophaceae bacterium PtaU1.Bin231]HOG17350.1 arsenosugar biosynthesis radical SAM protein ArsS [Syntrophales bacterium]
MNAFDRKVRRVLPEGLVSGEVRVLQINLGRHCNLSCSHCHLECSPSRRERMTQAVMGEILSRIGGRTFDRVDITGGSPELHPHFRTFLEKLCAEGCPVQVRTNLTNLAGPPLSGLIPFFRDRRVSLVGSLPCYEEENVDLQRGPGVHERSIAALRLLNRAGYGVEEALPLDLVYNPGGPFLPPQQAELEGIYRGELGRRFGVRFSRLLVLTNMPIGRFGRQLEQGGEMAAYRKLLEDSFNPATLARLMCRHQISVDWDGRLYDCDFNLALGMPVNHGSPNTLAAARLDRLASRSIMTGSHCFGCTAGSGSSCAGALAPPSASS